MRDENLAGSRVNKTISETISALQETPDLNKEKAQITANNPDNNKTPLNIPKTEISPLSARSIQRAAEASQRIKIIPPEESLSPDVQYDPNTETYYKVIKDSTPTQTYVDLHSIPYGDKKNTLFYGAAKNPANVIIGDYIKNNSDLHDERIANKEAINTENYDVKVSAGTAADFPTPVSADKDSQEFKRSLKLKIGDAIEYNGLTDFARGVVNGYFWQPAQALVSGLAAIAGAGTGLSPSSLKDLKDEEIIEALGVWPELAKYKEKQDLSFSEKFMVSYARASNVIKDTYKKMGIIREVNGEKVNYGEQIGEAVGSLGLSGLACLVPGLAPVALFSALSASGVLEHEIEKGKETQGYATESGRSIALALSVGAISGLIERFQGRIVGKWLSKVGKAVDDTENVLFENIEKVTLDKMLAKQMRGKFEAAQWISGEKTVLREMFRHNWWKECVEEMAEEVSQGLVEDIIPQSLGYQGYVDWEEVGRNVLINAAGGFIGAGVLKGTYLFMQSSQYKIFAKKMKSGLIEQGKTEKEADKMLLDYANSIIQNTKYKQDELISEMQRISENPEQFEQQNKDAIEELENNNSDVEEKELLREAAEVNSKLFTKRGTPRKLPLPKQYIRKKSFITPNQKAVAVAVKDKIKSDYIADMTGADAKKIYQEYTQKERWKISQMSMEERENYKAARFFEQAGNTQFLQDGIDLFIDAHEETLNIALEVKKRKAAQPDPYAKLSISQMKTRYGKGQTLALINWIGQPSMDKEGRYYFTKEQREQFAKEYLVYHNDGNLDLTRKYAKEKRDMFRALKNMQMDIFNEFVKYGVIKDEKTIELFENFFGKSIPTLFDEEQQAYTAEDLEKVYRDLEAGIKPSKYISSMVRAAGEVFVQMQNSPSFKQSLKYYLKARGRKQKAELATLKRNLNALAGQLSSDIVPEWLKSAAKREKKEEQTFVQSKKFLEELRQAKYLDEEGLSLLDKLERDEASLSETRNYILDKLLRTPEYRLRLATFADEEIIKDENYFMMKQINRLNEMFKIITRPEIFNKTKKLMSEKAELERTGFTVHDYEQIARAAEVVADARRIIVDNVKEGEKNLDKNYNDIKMAALIMQSSAENLNLDVPHLNEWVEFEADNIHDKKKAIENLGRAIIETSDLLQKYAAGKDLISYYGKDFSIIKINNEETKARIMSVIGAINAKQGSTINSPEISRKLTTELFSGVGGERLRKIPVEYTQELVRLVANSASTETIAFEVDNVLSKIQDKLDKSYINKMKTEINKVSNNIFAEILRKDKTYTYEQKKAFNAVKKNIDAIWPKAKEELNITKKISELTAEEKENFYKAQAKEFNNYRKDMNKLLTLNDKPLKGSNKKDITWDSLDDYSKNLILTLLDCKNLEITGQSPQSFYRGYEMLMKARLGIQTDAYVRLKERETQTQTEIKNYLNAAINRQKKDTAYDDSWWKRTKLWVLNCFADISTYDKIIFGERFANKFDLTYQNISAVNMVDEANQNIESLVRANLNEDTKGKTVKIAEYAAECRAAKCFNDENDLLEDFRSIGEAGKSLVERYEKNKKLKKYREFLRINKAQLMYLYSVSLNEKGANRLVKDYGEEILEWINGTKILTAYDKLYTQQLIRIRESFYPSVNNVYRDINNCDLGYELNYTPLLYSGGDAGDFSSAEQNTLSFFAGNLAENSTEIETADFTIKRKETVGPDKYLKTADLFQVHQKYLTDAATFINVTPIVNAKMNLIFNTKITTGEYEGMTIKDYLTEQYGEQLVKQYKIMLNFNRGVKPKQIDNKASNVLISAVVKNMGIAKVVNPNVWARQPVSTYNMFHDVPSTFAINAFLDSISSPVETWDFMMTHCQNIMRRLEGRYPDAFVRNAEYNIFGYVAKAVKIPWNESKADNLLLTGNRYADITAIVYGGKVYYDWLKTQKNEKGEYYSDTEIERLVSIRMQQTQQSANASELAYGQMQQKNLLSAALYAFRSSQLATARIAAVKLNEISNGKGGLRELAQALLVLLFGSLTVKWVSDPEGSAEAIISLFQDKDIAYSGDKYRYENLVRPIILMGVQWNAIAEFLGTAVCDTIAKTVWKNQDVPRVQDSFGILYLDDPLKGLTALSKAYEKGDWAGVAWGAGFMLQDFHTFPTAYAKRFIQGLAEMKEDRYMKGLLLMSGVTERNAKKVKYYRSSNITKYVPSMNNLEMLNYYAKVKQEKKGEKKPEPATKLSGTPVEFLEK